MDGREIVGPAPYVPGSAGGTANGGGMGLSFGQTPPSPPVLMGLGTGERARKRGRPRKYAPDGSMIVAATPTLARADAASWEPSGKRRGRPPGSGRKRQLDALGSGGIAFTPHVITLKAGEDIASRIMAFSQLGPRTICILSASGAVSNVALRQPTISGGTATYEGHFDILSLSGSFLPTDNGATRSRTGGLSVALVGPDGRILGGAVTGMLIAATPVQVFLASFIMGGKRPKAERVKQEPPSCSPSMVGFGAASATSPPSQGTSSESSEDSGSPLDQSDGACNNSGQHIPSSYASVGWPSSNQ